MTFVDGDVKPYSLSLLVDACTETLPTCDFDCYAQRILSRESLKGEIMLLAVCVPLSLFQLECSSLNDELAVRAQQIQDLYVQFSVNQHRDLVRE